MPKRSLKPYEAKRDFSRTPEPSGRAKPAKPPKANGQLFCIQKHLATRLHYDLRLEHNGVLLSWAVPRGPSLNPRDKRLAMRVEDHPLAYAKFEGVIPQGYGAGVVMLWDLGTWRPAPGFEDVDAALKKGELKFTVDGGKIHGGFVMVRIGEATAGGEREQWLLIKHRDEWAGDVDVTELFPRSIEGDQTFTQIVASKPEVWQSHKVDEKDLDTSLRKIVAKVVKLEGEPTREDIVVRQPKRQKRRKG